MLMLGELQVCSAAHQRDWTDWRNKVLDDCMGRLQIVAIEDAVQVAP